MFESFSSPQVMKICRITKRQLQTWLESGLITPSVFQGEGRGEHHRYSFIDLVAIRTLVEIRQQGMSVQVIKRIAERVVEYGGSSFADCFLAFDGHDVILRRGEDLVSLIRNPGQLAFMWVISLDHLEKEVRQSVTDAKKKAA